MLHNLNERLVGRRGRSSPRPSWRTLPPTARWILQTRDTCHPYLDGKEVELPGALPLGVAKRGVYETTRFCIQAGGRLTFYSDGVVEAQSQKGELFGFERAASTPQNRR